MAKKVTSKRSQHPRRTDDPVAPIIVIGGDLSFDWLCFPKADTHSTGTETESHSRVWQSGSRVELPVVHGGAWYLETAIRTYLGPAENEHVFSYTRLPTRELRSANSKLFTHSLTNYVPLPAQAGTMPSSDLVLRTPHDETTRFFGPEQNHVHPVLLPDSVSQKERYLSGEEVEWGFSPDKDDLEFTSTLLRQIRWFPANRPRIVALLDRGNGFVDHRSLIAKPRSVSGPAFRREADVNWKHLLPPAGSANDVVSVVLATKNCASFLHNKSGSAALWKYLEEHDYYNRTIIILDVSDLRNAGVRISRNESWERSANDILSQLEDNPLLKELSKAGHLIVRFGLSGAFYHERDTGNNVLFFDPYHSEGEYRVETEEGRMFGVDMVMSGTIVAGLWHLNKHDRRRSSEAALSKTIQRLILHGLANARSFFRHGWGRPRDGIDREIERWDKKAAAALTYDSTRRLLEKRISIVGAYQAAVLYSEDQTPPIEDSSDLRITLQIDVNDDFHMVDMLRDPSVVIGYVVSRLKSAAEEQLTSAYLEAGCDDRSAFSLSFDVPHDRIGKATGQLVCKLPESWEEKCRLFGAFKKRVGASHQLSCKDLHAKEFKKSEDAVRGKWRSRFHDVLVDGLCCWHEGTSQDLHWRFDAPVTLLGIKERDEIVSTKISGGSDWSILHPADAGLPELAQNIVRLGMRDGLQVNADDYRPFPVVQFGNLWCVDRREIESYRSIKTLIENYCRRTAAPRPLCIGVFGPPGSGKSFGVQQIACGVRGTSEGAYEYNLSQFTRPEDLADAFIRVRNQSHDGVIPLVFLDEFDCKFEQSELGWLKYFLSVMQDGQFRFNSDVLGIGSAILVFAGGTRHSYSDFVSTDSEKRSFVDAKGPDFVSRLRGYVDIVGINADVDSDPKDKAYMIRRALILRSLIDRHYRDLLDESGWLRIDTAVLKALLEVASYQHGARSLEAILEMSSLHGPRFQKSSLPPFEQLQIHLGDTESDRNVAGEFMAALA